VDGRASRRDGGVRSPGLRFSPPSVGNTFWSMFGKASGMLHHQNPAAGYADGTRWRGVRCRGRGSWRTRATCAAAWTTWVRQEVDVAKNKIQRLRADAGRGHVRMALRAGGRTTKWPSAGLQATVAARIRQALHGMDVQTWHRTGMGIIDSIPHSIDASHPYVTDSAWGWTCRSDSAFRR